MKNRLRDRVQFFSSLPGSDTPHDSVLHRRPTHVNLAPLSKLSETDVTQKIECGERPLWRDTLNPMSPVTSACRSELDWRNSPKPRSIRSLDACYHVLGERDDGVIQSKSCTIESAL